MSMPPASSPDLVLRTAACVVAAILGFAAVSVAGTVFAPVALALFILALTWPLQRRLQTLMPRMLALAVSMVVLIVVAVAFGSLIAWGFGRVARWVIADAGRLQGVYDQVTAWLEGHGIAVAGVWSEHFNVGWMLRALQGVTGRVNATMSFWLVVLVYVLLGLLEVEDFARKAKTLRSRDFARVLVQGTEQTAAKIRRYMIVRTQMSVLTGVLVWIFAWAAGLQFAAEWGVIAFALNYIPFLGPLIATVFPTLFAIAQFDTWQAAIAVFLCLNAIQFVVGSYIEPRVSGNALAIAPSVVLFAVFFWTYLWGIFGAFIGVPVTIALLTFCAQHPSSRWISDLLGMPEDEAREKAAT
jgi:AI-2 transport protein TqsA